VDLYPHGCLVIQAHYFFFLDIPIVCMIHTHCVHDLNQYFTRTIIVSSSLRSLTLQAQAHASPSLLYSSSGDPSCLAKAFLHRKNPRDFIEPYSRGIPSDCVTSTQHIPGNHGLPRGSHGLAMASFMIFNWIAFIRPFWTYLFFSRVSQAYKIHETSSQF
jgi:hypothetical protein